MPNHTVSGNVDTMMRAADNAAIRSAIGVGTTDAPTFLAQTLTGQSLTGTQATNLLDLATTWNTTGTPSALKLNVTDTASNAASNLMDLQVGGVSKFKISKNGLLTTRYAGLLNGPVFSFDSGAGDMSIGFLQNDNPYIGRYGRHVISVGSFATLDAGYFSLNSGGVDVWRLYADNLNVLAQRNGSAAQAFRVYNTYTDASNYERLTVDFSSGNARFIHQRSGAAASTPRALAFYGEAGVYFGASAGSTNHWYMLSAGNLLAGADNTYDIGASGANRPKNIYAGTALISGGSVQVGSGGNQLIFGGRGSISPFLDGVWAFYNSSANDFGRICLGGGTSAYPAIKRNGTGIDIVLANDSGFAPVKGKLTTDTAYTATVVAATGYITIYDSTGTAYRVPCAV